MASLSLWVGNEARKGPRQGRHGHALADHAAREQVAVAVVVERDGLGGRAGGALEDDVLNLRRFSAAMPGAEARVLRWRRACHIRCGLCPPLGGRGRGATADAPRW